jgi:hypothetical protein
VVGFDSIIPPGRVGSITEKIRLANYHSGNYSKAATITSNAKNSPTLVITMKWTMKAFVGVSTSNLQINRNNEGIYQAEVTLSSEKADLKLLGINFKPIGDKPPSDKMASWQEELTIPLSFMLTKDSVTQEKMHEFKYKVTASYTEVDIKRGDFIFKTNHPEAPEVKVSGEINPGPVRK